MHKRKRQHGFTLIELIVVIAVIGLLALLSIPKLIGYTQEAHQARIVNDTKVMEGKVFEHLIKNDDKLPDDFTRLDDISNLETAKLENKLYTFKGLVKTDETLPIGDFYEVTDNFIKTKLKGYFYVHEQSGTVYYLDVKAGKVDTPNTGDNENTIADDINNLNEELSNLPENPTNDDFQAIEDKIGDIQEKIDNMPPSQEKDKAQEDLDELKDKLEDIKNPPVKADKTLLISKINEANNLIENDYISGWTEFQAKLSNAIAIRDGDDYIAQSEVDNALNELTTAITNLVNKPDKTLLTSKISEAESLTEGDYINGWAELQLALTNAISVMNNNLSTQTEVDNALNELNMAIDNLEEKPAEPVALSEVPLGSIIYDPSWTWEHKTGIAYTGSGEVKPVEWLVVAENKYQTPSESITVISNELIGKQRFDSRSSYSNFWIDSDVIRPWLNNTFYSSFSADFKDKVLKTVVVTSTYEGALYTTEDNVFLPSTKELSIGGPLANEPHNAGYDWLYFDSNESRVATLAGTPTSYWTRIPSKNTYTSIRAVSSSGVFDVSALANSTNLGVRPVINLKSDTMVMPDGTGKYIITYN